ncbi:sestrin-1-like [Corticium candelabrum]|uniref:sestrin-1-like n=1 Tax=Corticium candelabrum TaxID=121492 RepID=UPI002E267940|nr:sestrin-1-like [Corticium candelabrum]
MADDDVYDDDFVCKLFSSGIGTRNVASRTSALDSIALCLETWSTACQTASEDRQRARKLLRDYLPTLLRLSDVCPFADVSVKCQSILQSAEARGVRIPLRKYDGPTSFIANSKVVPLNTENEETHELFVEAFLVDNRVTNMVRLMGYHPRYLTCFLRFHTYLMFQDGPLPLHLRHYIAILAAARHRCSYLVSLCEINFVNLGGDPKWLEGLENVPPKIQALNDINNIICHQPWLIAKTDIEALVQPGPNGWSLSELMHAVVILCHYHCLSGFAHGCCLNPEIDTKDGHIMRPLSQEVETDILPNGSRRSSAISSIGSSMPSTPRGSLTSEATLADDGDDRESEEIRILEHLREELSDDEMTTTELELQEFETQSKASAEITPSSGGTLPANGLARYMEEPEFQHQDFTQSGLNTSRTFRVLDYSWEDHGYSLANRLYPDVGQLLEEKFRLTSVLTYQTFGSTTDVDTSRFRCAVWNYIHCIKGIYHDDYHYAEVNKLLNIPIKKYIKLVTCYPERVTVTDFRGFMNILSPSEKVHLNLLLLEARLQAELLYVLRAIMQHMT